MAHAVRGLRRGPRSDSGPAGKWGRWGICGSWPSTGCCAPMRCGESYERSLVGETAQMVFTDPPYNVRIDGHVGGAR